MLLMIETIKTTYGISDNGEDMNVKIDMTKVLGYIFYGVGIVGGVESFVIGGSTGRGVAAVATCMIIAGSLFLGMRIKK